MNYEWIQKNEHVMNINKRKRIWRPTKTEKKTKYNLYQIVKICHNLLHFEKNGRKKRKHTEN